MIDESLLKSHFLGKDGFSWWIGRVAHQDYWKNINLANSFKGKTSQRCKVRIIGYHPWDNTLKEEDLPWAQVMMDAITGSGQGTKGDTLNLVGGETAIGFFLDGEEAQQPVIIGLLNRAADVGDSISESELKSVQSNYFRNMSGKAKGATERESVATKTAAADRESVTTTTAAAGGGTTTAAAGGGAKVSNTNKKNASVVLRDGEASLAVKGLEKKTDKKITTNPSMCGEGVLSDVSQALTDFISFTNGLENDLGRYIDPITNKIVDMSTKIKQVAQQIQGMVKTVINSIRSGMIKKILGLFKILAVLNKKINPLDFFLGPAAKKAFMKVLEMLYCVFQKMMGFNGDLFGFINKMLENMVSKIINGPFCAVEQFVSGLFNKVFNMLEGALAPILNGIDWLTGGLSNIMGVFSQASSLARKIFSFLECTGVKCSTPSTWTSKVGESILGPVDKWEESINKMDFVTGVQSDLSKFEKRIGSSKLMQWFNGQDTESAEGVSFNGIPVLDLLNNVKKLSGGKVDPTNVLGSIEAAIGTLSIFGNGHSALSACDDSIWNPKTQYDLINSPIGHQHWVCIPPVTEITGAGFGAVTKPVIAPNGAIFSIEVIHGGSGYDNATSVAIIDNSNYGSGARGKVIVENGSVKEIVLLSSGSGYCGGDANDIVGIPTGVTGGIGTSIVGIVTSIYIDKPGIGYTSGDTAGIGTFINLPIQVTDNGSIVSVDNSSISGLGFSKRPRVIINSDNGVGADLIPIMKYNVQITGTSDLGGVKPLIGITSVIDCPPEDHIFNNN